MGASKNLSPKNDLLTACADWRYVYALTNSRQGLYNIPQSSSHATHSFQLSVTESISVKRDAGICLLRRLQVLSLPLYTDL